MSEREPNLAQPWAPHRKRIYLAVAASPASYSAG